MAVTTLRPSSPLGEASPALGRTVDLAFQLARGVSAAVAVCGYGFLALSWGWSDAWIVVAVSAAIGADAVLRRTRGNQQVLLALGVDILWVTMIFVATNPPALVVVPGLTYLVVAPVLALDGWKAAGMVVAAMVGIATAMTVSLWAPPLGLATGQIVTLAVVGVLVHLPTMIWLILSATKTLRSNHELAADLSGKEAQLRMITDTATDGIMALDGSGRIRFANRAVETLFGWTAAEMAGRSVTDFIPSFGQTRTGRPAHRNDYLQMALPGINRNGSSIPLELTLGRTDEGEQPVYVCMLRDVSEREQAARRIEFQATLLDQVRLAIVAARPDGRLVYANASAVADFGLRPEAMPNVALWELLADPEQGRAFRKSMGNDVAISAEMQLRTSDGTSFPALVTVTRVHDRSGEPIGFAGIAVDITERKRTEEKLAALVASKDEFVTSVSHELRTPLTVILGMAEELRRDFAQFSSDDVHQLIELIADQSRDLANIVQDLLVIGRAEAGGKLVIHGGPVDLKSELANALEVYVPFDRNPVLLVDAPFEVWCDAGRLRQVIRNLLTNAVRYGGPNLKVEARQGPATTTVTVAEDGQGVLPDDIERIFEPYVRSKTGPALPASMGLGLAVARKLCRLMDGDLTYRREGAWSIFELILPNVPEATS